MVAGSTALRMLWQDDQESEGSLGYIGRFQASKCDPDVTQGISIGNPSKDIPRNQAC